MILARCATQTAKRICPEKLHLLIKNRSTQRRGIKESGSHRVQTEISCIWGLASSKLHIFHPWSATERKFTS